ncbi:MAG: T9SS type A sorting domain-containing protein, partial [Bacteroidales bacterium]|nr:T9SS type A sorting domain-containing protein [Bacteroidales bacterium]
NYDTVVVSLPPGPVITTSKDTVLCANQPLTLWASGADSVVWSSGQAGDSITINPTTSGNYILAGYNLYGCATFDTISVIVMPLPNPSFPYDSLVLNYPDSILLSPGSFDNYLWSTGDTTPSVLFHGGMVATISVIVTDSNGCSASDSITFLVESIDDVKLQIGVKIFPNPATDFLHIQMDRLVDIQRIEMMDMEGRMVLQRTYNAALQQIKLQLPNLNKGVYILRLIGSKGVIDLKVMVE